MRIAEALVDKRGKVNDVLFSALKNNLDHFTNPMKHITIDGIDGVAKAISALQNNHPEWFPDGLKGVYAVSDSRFFAAYHQSNLYLSDATDSISGFQQTNEIILALKSIQKGESLTINNEYAIETIYHEIIHSEGRHEIDNRNFIFQVEPIIQWIARNDYPVLLNVFGYQAEHQEYIIKHGYGYHNYVSNLTWLFTRLGITPINELRKSVKKVRFTEIRGDAIKNIAELSGLTEQKISRCFNYLRVENSLDYRAKVENILNHRSNQTE
jgi:hypothetical protein